MDLHMSTKSSTFAHKLIGTRLLKEKTMKIGIYGGSFNPVHFGHIGLVKWTLEHTDLDEIWMLVSPKSPHKTDRADLDSNYPQRLAAAREAMAKVEVPGKKIVVSDFELGLPIPSYTANTLRELQKAYHEHTFSLIIGEDNWKVFDKWREYEYILANYRIFIYPRHSASEEGKTIHTVSADLSRLCRDKNCQRPTVNYLSGAPLFDISSTEIRKKLQDSHI
jgi:nicotinate-nucleotide adenylyltransferase